jgi:amino acid adenylation domain-containing protein
MMPDDVVLELDCSLHGFEQLLFENYDVDLPRRLSLGALTDLIASAFAMPETPRPVAFDVYAGELPTAAALHSLRLELNRAPGRFTISYASPDQPRVWRPCVSGASTTLPAAGASPAMLDAGAPVDGSATEAWRKHVGSHGMFRAVHRTDRGLTLRFAVTPELRDECSRFSLHPLLLEAVLQAALQPLTVSGDEPGSPLPLRIERMAVAVFVPGAVPDGVALEQGTEGVAAALRVVTHAVIVDEVGRVIASLQSVASSSSDAIGAPRHVLLSRARLADLAAEALGRAVPPRTNLLELDVNSLDLVRLVTAVYAECQVHVPLAEFLTDPTLEHLYDLTMQGPGAFAVDLAERLQHVVLSSPSTTPGDAPLTSMQQALWLAGLRPDARDAYVERIAWRLLGDLDVAALRAAWMGLSQRYETLRCTVAEAAGRLNQRVLDPAQALLHLEHIDPAADANAQIEDWLHRAQQRAFVCGEPLARIELLRLNAQDHVLLLLAHHAVCDGGSLHEHVVPELAELYGCALHGDPAQARAPSAQPRHLAAWETHADCAAHLAREADAWAAELCAAPEAAALPTDWPRAGHYSHRAGQLVVELSPELLDRLGGFARHQRQSRFVIALTAFSALLYRFSGARDLLIGVPIAQRFSPLLANAVGCLINFAPIHVRVDGAMPLAALLQRVGDEVARALDRQHVPFQLAAKRLSEEDRSSAANPCVGFTYEAESAALQLQGVTAQPLQLALDSTKLELFLRIESSSGRLRLSFEYGADLFASDTIATLARRYERCLAELIEAPSTRVMDMAWLLADERQAALHCARGQTLAQGRLCPALLAARVDISAQVIAVTDGERALSYEGLEAAASALAASLRGQGVRRGECVVVYLESCVDWPVAVLAIWKVGAAIVPIDAEQPHARQAHMFETARARVAITHRARAAELGAFNLRAIAIDDPRPTVAAADVSVGPSDLAYGIFTSGSTGLPKLALANHGGLANKVMAQLETFRIHPAARVLQFASPAFDAALSELLLAFSAGATLFVPPRPVRHSGELLADLLRRERIEVAMLTPSVLGTMPFTDLPALRLLLLVGEPCRAELVDTWATGRELYNLYGPTEATIWATSERCQSECGDPSIGRPIPNTWVYILDDDLNLLAPGQIGEICIGGAGVGPGYLHASERDQARFVHDRYCGDTVARMYLTGDRGRYLPDGRIAFLGRKDDQVKLFGRRIELGEIETALRRLPDIEDAVVVVHESGSAQARLSAFVQTGGASVSAMGIREALREFLPSYMLPTSISVVTAWPRLLSGKADRKQLALRPLSRVTSGAVTTPAQRRIADVFAKVLGISPTAVGLFDDFFVLGGHSLSVVTLAEELAMGGLRVSVADLMRGARVVDLAAQLDGDVVPDTTLEPAIEP